MAFWNAPPFKYGLFWVSMLVLRGVHLQMGWLFYCPLSVRGCIPTLEESFWSSTWHFCLAMHKNMMQPKRMLHSEVTIGYQPKQSTTGHLRRLRQKFQSLMGQTWEEEQTNILGITMALHGKLPQESPYVRIQNGSHVTTPDLSIHWPGTFNQQSCAEGTAWFSMFAQIKNCWITVENHDLEYRTHLYNILPT